MLSSTEELVVRLSLLEKTFETISDTMFFNTIRNEGRITQADQAMNRKTFLEYQREIDHKLDHVWFPAYQDGGRIDAAKADVFALGCMMLELISGEHPFAEMKMMEGKGLIHQHQYAYTLIPRFRLQPKRCYTQIPKEVGAVFKAACEMLHPNPDERVSAAAASLHPWIFESQ